MRGFFKRLCLVILLLTGLTRTAFCQQVFTWEQVRSKFEAANPTLKAAQASIDESRTSEITAYLRPNPNLTLATDGTQITRFEGVWQPFKGTTLSPGVSYLHERGGK